MALKAEIEKKRQHYTQLQTANAHKTAVAAGLERDIEVLGRKHHTTTSDFKGLYHRVQLESETTTAAVTRAQRTINELEELYRGMSQGLANTLSNLETKTQEAWKLVRRYGNLQEKVKSRYLLTALENKLCGHCEEALGVKHKEPSKSTFIKGSTAAGSSRMLEAKVCEACSLL